MLNIDINKFLLQLTPAYMRSPVINAWLKALTYPVKQVYDRFQLYRAAKDYELTHNGQVFSLENVFNDRFDNIERRIYITDGFTKERFYIFTRDEAKPEYLPKFIHNREDYADTGVDFIVWVPAAVFITEDEMIELKALVDRYKVDPKRYKIYRS